MEDLKRIVTNRVRFSYTHLFTPRTPTNPGEKAKYSVTLLIPKSDVDTRRRIDAAIQAAAEEGVQKKWGGVRPPQPPVPIYDGDGLRPSGEAFGEECRGCWVLAASGEMQPQVVDANCNPIIDQTQIYSGCYGRASIRFFAYNASGKKGIGCGLGNVQKLEDGEPLGGRSNAADDFGAPAQPQYPQPSAYPAAQPQYPQPSAYPAAQQINPITGQPYVPGSVMGL